MAKSQQGSRGPKRSRASKIKMRCAFKRCRRNVDVKNAGAERQLKCQEVNMVMCRAVRKHCKTIRFCCKDHLKQCKATPPRKSGGKEALTQNQCITLIQTLLVICPWAAVLSLLQLFIIDRADCARSCRWGWLSGMEPDSKRQASITIPKVNGKTIPRTIPIYQPFAALLWKTIHGNPIEAPSGEMWPAAGQDVDSPESPLFPGFEADGKTRNWNKPISERAYLARVEQAAKILRAQRAVAQASNVAHAFHDFDLSRLGTHSFKKTSVTLFSEHQVSWAIISAISGTSIPMLQRSYDVATPVRQHKAMKDVFGQAWQPVLLTQRAHLEEKDSQPAKYCGKCGLSRRHPDDIFCTACGSEL